MAPVLGKLLAALSGALATIAGHAELCAAEYVAFPVSPAHVERSDHDVGPLVAGMQGFMTQTECCGGQYALDVLVGTPPQKIRAVISMASSYFWTYGTCESQDPETLDTETQDEETQESDTQGGDADDGETQDDQTQQIDAIRSMCRLSGSYDPAKSQTATAKKGEMHVTLPGGNLTGDYHTDVISLGGANFSGYNFSVVSQNTKAYLDSLPFLGLSYPVDANGGIIDYMYAFKKIGRKTISLSLNQTEKRGDLLVGGIDTKKYSGSLTKIDLVPYYALYAVKVASMALDVPNVRALAFTGAETFDRCIIDAGSSVLSVPQSVFEFWLEQVLSDQVAHRSNINMPLEIDCDVAANKGGSLKIDLGSGRVFDIPMKALVRRTKDGTVCYFAVTFNDENCFLGEPFLESVYTTIDMTEKVAYMAQHHDCGSDVVDLAGASIQGIKGQCV